MTTLSRLGVPLALLALAPLAAGCSDSLGAPGVGSSAQTTDALALLPADAEMAGMMNLASARASGAIDDMLGGSGLEMVTTDGAEDFEAFVRMTGFDPNEDLDRVFLAASETEGRAAFVAYGRFDRERIERYLADQDEAEFEATEIEGLPVYLLDDDGERAGFALVNAEMVLAGDEATLTDMIGRLGTQRAPSADLQALLDRVEYPDGAWFVARNLDRRTAGISADAGPEAAAARAASAMVMSMGFQDDGIPVRAFLVTREGASADDVADVFRGGLSAAKIGLKDEPAALDVIDRVEVDAEAEGVRVEAFLTGEFLASVSRD